MVQHSTYQPPPLLYPVIPPGSNAAQRELLHATNEEDQQAWQTYLIVEMKGVNQLAEAFDDVYYAELDDPDEDLAGVNIMQFLDHTGLRYCQISQPELDYQQPLLILLPDASDLLENTSQTR